MYCIVLRCFLFLEDFRKGTFTTKREHSVFPNWVEAITPMVRKQLLGGGRCVFFQGGKISKYISRDPVPPGFPSTRSWICRVSFWGGPSWKIYREQVKKNVTALGGTTSTVQGQTTFGDISGLWGACVFSHHLTTDSSYCESLTRSLPLAWCLLARAMIWQDL